MKKSSDEVNPDSEFLKYPTLEPHQHRELFRNRYQAKKETQGMVIIWSCDGGRMLKKCKSIQEAEDFINECGWIELDRTEKGSDTNICVLEF